MVKKHPVLVVGAGPTGLACARALRMQGESPLLLERRAWPVDKVCGEGIMPVGLRSLQQLGVRLEPGRAFRGISYHLRNLQLRGDFAEGPGRGVRRLELVRALEQPDIVSGVDVQAVQRVGERIEVRTNRGVWRCRLLVAADGLHSVVRRSLGWDAGGGWLRRWGMRAHFGCAPWSEYVEVHTVAGAEAYVTPVADNLVGVAVLARKGINRSNWLEPFPALRERLSGSSAVSPLRGHGPLWQRSRRVHAPGVLLAGDAAGYLDACTGEGLSLGFAQALALGELWAAHGAGGDLVVLPGYAKRYRAITAHYRLVTGAMLLLNHLPGAQRLVFSALRRRPAVLQALLSANQGLAGPGDVFRALWHAPD
jgi:flavin-dependent dehydrogenase